MATKKKAALPSVKAKLASLAKKAASKGGFQAKSRDSKSISASKKSLSIAASKASTKAPAKTSAKGAAHPIAASAPKSPAKATAASSKKPALEQAAGKAKVVPQAEVKAAAPKTPAKITSSQKSKPVAKTPAAPKVKKEAVPEITLTPFDWYAAAKERFSVAKKREAMGYVSAERFARLVVEGEEA